MSYRTLMIIAHLGCYLGAPSIVADVFGQTRPEQFVQRADSIDAVVDVQYSYAPGTNLYTYTYRLVSKHSSRQPVSELALETTGRIVSMTSPLGWDFGKFVDRPLVHWYGVTLDPTAQFYVRPQQEATFTLTSPDPPGVGWLYVQGHTDIPKLSRATGELAHTYPALFDVTVNSRRMRGVVPRAVRPLRVELRDKKLSLSNWTDSVAVRAFGNEGLDVADVAWEKWTLGSAGARELHENVHLEDFDKDGFADVELHFRVGAIGVRPGTDRVCLHALSKESVWMGACLEVDVTQG